MDTLPLELNKNGYKYTQVLRGVNTCLYSQSIDGNIIAYEVFIIRSRPKRIAYSNVVNAKEVFPSNEDFGPYAKVSLTESGALKIFQYAEKYMIKRFSQDGRV